MKYLIESEIEFFSTLDVTQAFWQIPLDKESQKYTGFLFNNHTYVFKRLPFGLKTAGASFTRAMNRTLHDESLDFVIVYLDDILIASNSLKEHLKHIDIVLSKLRKAGFKLNKDKCEFVRREVKFLGHTFDEITASINDETRCAIKSFPRPKNIKAVQAFLGLANWDRRFIKNLARLTKPLERLLKKDVKFEWSETEQEAFNAIKRAFEDAPTLYLIKANMNFGIDVDASKTGIGARLFQYNESEPTEKFTIGYASRSLKSAEKNYTVTELECLALIFALKKWHTLLMGRRVKVNTDHRALQFISSCANASERIARWMSFMQEFDLQIQHIPGNKNETADALSREFDEKSSRTPKENVFQICSMLQDEKDHNSQKWYEMIKNAQEKDNRLQQTAALPETKYHKREGLIRIKKEDNERIIVPEAIAWTLVESIHKFLLHFGTDKIANFAKKYFEIGNIDRITRDVVASCETCIATKYYTRPTRGVEYYELPDDKDKTISLDIFGPLPRTQSSNRYIVVMMDQFSKLVNCYPVTNQKLQTITETIDTEYLEKMPVPETILTDNGGQFLTEEWKRRGSKRIPSQENITLQSSIQPGRKGNERTRKSD